jgi:hypothetical protein
MGVYGTIASVACILIQAIGSRNARTVADERRCQSICYALIGHVNSVRRQQTEARLVRDLATPFIIKSLPSMRLTVIRC